VPLVLLLSVAFDFLHWGRRGAEARFGLNGRPHAHLSVACLLTKCLPRQLAL